MKKAGVRPKLTAIVAGDVLIAAARNGQRRGWRDSTGYGVCVAVRMVVAGDVLIAAARHMAGRRCSYADVGSTRRHVSKSRRNP